MYPAEPHDMFLQARNEYKIFVTGTGCLYSPQSFGSDVLDFQQPAKISLFNFAAFTLLMTFFGIVHAISNSNWQLMLNANIFLYEVQLERKEP